MNSENTTYPEYKDIFIPQSAPQDESLSQIEYSEGEIVKCYYSVVDKVGDGKVSQRILKCHSFGKILSRNRGDKKEYTVKLFDPFGDVDTKRVPGCCLRKVKTLPYTFEDAKKIIGRTVVSKDGKEIMLVVAVTKNDEFTRINDIDANEILSDFEFADNGSPCGNIVMLKADEAFSAKA